MSVLLAIRNQLPVDEAKIGTEIPKSVTEIGDRRDDPLTAIRRWHWTRPDGTVTYIYSVNYEMQILKGIIHKLCDSGIVYVVNPAFVPGLQIREDGHV